MPQRGAIVNRGKKLLRCHSIGGEELHTLSPDESTIDKDTSNNVTTIRSYCGGGCSIADSACLPTFKILEGISKHH